jgi:Tfp pilus assembly protein PilX
MSFEAAQSFLRAEEQVLRDNSRDFEAHSEQGRPDATHGKVGTVCGLMRDRN